MSNKSERNYKVLLEFVIQKQNGTRRQHPNSINHISHFAHNTESDYTTLRHKYICKIQYCSILFDLTIDIDRGKFVVDAFGDRLFRNGEIIRVVTSKSKVLEDE